jgi:inactivated superfamily I helicase
MLLVDAANVIGSRPTGWWRDRAGAARAFVETIRAAVVAGRVTPPVVVVLEGKARAGAPQGLLDGVTVLHADARGDDLMVDVVGEASNATEQSTVTLVTADRVLRRRAEALGADIVGPNWLLGRLDPPTERAPLHG